MSKSPSRRSIPFRRLNAPYRVVFIDDNSLEEVASFSLTKSRMYMLFSTIFVIIVSITVMILLFTPLKYYIPGYGSNRANIEVIRMKHKVDSLADMVQSQQAYADNLKKVIVGDYRGLRDTTMLDMEKVRREDMNSILPSPDAIKEQALPGTDGGIRR
jgi:hypothetical protein